MGRLGLICYLFSNKWSFMWAKIALCWILRLKNSIMVLERISDTVVKFDLGLLYRMWFSSSEVQIMLGAALYRVTSPATRTRVTSSSPPTLCSYSSRWVPSTATLNMSSSTRIFSCRENTASQGNLGNASGANYTFHRKINLQSSKWSVSGLSCCHLLQLLSVLW